MHHLRDSVRHILAAVLVAGTLAGTTWTFSNGTLTLAGAWERLVSVGGIAAALEVGLIYCGWYIGQLDQRIQAARRRDLASRYRTQQRQLYYWFGTVAVISALANFFFRVQQLDNALLAAFVSASPIVLVILFTIVLRPLPVDYDEIGRRATGRALARLAEESERTMLRVLARMGKGKSIDDAMMAQFRVASGFIALRAATDEQHALDHVVTLAGPAQGPLEIEAAVWLRTEDLMHLYGISKRSAQAWMARTPGRRKVANSNAWEAPESAVLAAHGMPRSARSARAETLSVAADPQPSAVPAQL